MTTLVVVDEGSNQVKAVWINPDTHAIEHRIIPSRVTSENGEDEEGLPFPYVYTIDNQHYSVVEDGTQLLPTKGSDFQVSNHNLALVHEILRPIFGNQSINLHVTLPIFQFYNIDNTRNSQRITEKTTLLNKPVRNPAGHSLAIFNKVNVSPEGIPVWFDVLFNDQLTFNPKYEFVERVLVVDIGGTTTDISMITGGGRIIQKGSIEIGCFRVADNLRAELNAGHASNLAIEKAMRTSTFRKKTIDQELQQAIFPVAEHIYHQMKIFEKDEKALDYVVYAGGGATLIGQQLEDLYGGNTLIPDQPELALARGILKHKLITADRKAKAEA